MVNPASEAALNTEHTLNFMFDYRAQVDSQDSTFKCTGCKVELDKRNFKKKVDFKASKGECLTHHKVISSFVPKFDNLLILPQQGGKGEVTR